MTSFFVFGTMTRGVIPPPTPPPVPVTLFDEDLDVFFQDAELATFHLLGGDIQALLIRHSKFSTGGFDGVGISNANTFFRARTSQITGVAGEHRFSIGGEIFRVMVIQSDGTGISIIEAQGVNVNS